MPVKAILAFDIGGKSIKSGIVTQEGLRHVFPSCPLPFHIDTPELFFETLHSQVTLGLQFANDHNVEVEAVGVGVPGAIDEKTGVAYEAANLPWGPTNFKSLFEEWVHKPVFVAHDVRCGATAESQFGALRGEQDFLYIAIGTGLGSALSIQGQLYTGATGFGGEVGHSVVHPNGRMCGCGRRGCLEAYCSGKHIELQYKQHTGLLLTCQQIVSQSKVNDEVAKRIWDDAVYALALALVNYQIILEPAAIVIGGGVSTAGEELLLHPTVSMMRAIDPNIRMPKVRLSGLKEHSGLIGAGYQAHLRLWASANSRL